MTDANMYMKASEIRFLRIRSTASNENVENVVNAPRIPTVKNF